MTNAPPRDPIARDPIAELVHLYADAVVHHDAEQWSSTWALDAHWDFGKDRRLEGREAIVEFWHGAMSTFSAVVQTVHNGAYKLDAEAGTGTGRWYISEHFQRVNREAGKLLAHYDDTYTLTDDGWKFASRKLSIHYTGPQDLLGQFSNAWS